MAFNGSGVYTPPSSDFPAVSGTTIQSSKYNNVVNDIATGLSTAITKDGQTTPTANLSMGGYKHTGVGNSSARDSYAATGQVQDSSFTWAGTAGGTANAITLSTTPAITAYAAGQSFSYKSGASANTSTMTVNINSVGAKAIQKNGAAVASGDHPANMWFRITYDGTAFQLEQLAPTSAEVTASLALKAPLASPTFTGAPAAPTAAVGTSTTQLATTAFVMAQTATATRSGIVELATDAEAQTGTDTVRAVTPANLKAVALGFGQSYVNVSASRAIGGGPYTNSTGRAISLSINCLISVADAYLNIIVGGSTVGFSTQSYGANKAVTITNFVVPPGATYQVTASAGTTSSLTWNELT